MTNLEINVFDENFFDMTIRMAEVAEDDNHIIATQQKIDEMSEGHVPLNTKKKRDWSVNTYLNWRTKRNEMNIIEKIPTKPLEEMSPEELVFVLTRFILESRDKKGFSYKPKTMLEIILSIQQHINTKIENDKYAFLSDVRFKKLKNVLDSQVAEQVKQGQNLPKKSAEVVTAEMENKLWDQSLLGTDNPQKLLTTLMFYIGLNYALRGGTEHSQLLIDNFHENDDDSVTYTEFSSKNNVAGIKSLSKSPKTVTCYPNIAKPERSLSHLLKIYKMHRPSNTNKFYLRPLVKPRNNVWFSEQCVGLHKIESSMKNLMQSANISGYFTMHSLRATAATRLYEYGIEEQRICEITGHKSTAVRSYKRTNQCQSMEASAIVQAQGHQSTSQISSTTIERSESQIVIRENMNKRMKICADGERNIVQISFE